MSARAQARFEILDLLGRSTHAADDGSPQEFAATFTPNGVLHVRSGTSDDVWIVGHAELVQYALATKAGRDIRIARQHMGSTAILSLDGARATARSYVLTTSVLGPSEPSPSGTAVYDDIAVRTADGWRIAERHVHADATVRGLAG